MKSALLVTAIAFTFLWAPKASASDPCVDVPGFTFCALNPEQIHSSMIIVSETFNDLMLGHGEYRIDTRSGWFEDKSVSCMKGKALISTLRDFTSCRFNAYIATAAEAVKMFQWMDEQPTVQIVGADQRMLTYPFGKPQVPNGSRIRAERQLSHYFCNVRLDFDDLHFTELNIDRSAGSCWVHLVEHH